MPNIEKVREFQLSLVWSLFLLARAKLAGFLADWAALLSEGRSYKLGGRLSRADRDFVGPG